MNLYDYFNRRFSIIKSSKGWYRFYSPFSKGSTPSMAVNFTANRVICHRDHYKSSIKDFIKRVEGVDDYEIKSMIEDINNITPYKPEKAINIDYVKIPEHFYLFGEETAKLHKIAYKYIKTRNIDEQLIIDRSIGFCNDGEYKGYIIIPFINKRLEYYVGRNFLGDPKKRHKNPNIEKVGIGKSELLYNEQALNNEYIYLVEGVFDALTCGEFGVASLGWSLSITQLSKIINAPVKKIYVIPDPGFYKKALINVYSLLDFKEIYITNYMDSVDMDINKLGTLEPLVFNKVNLSMYHD